MPKLWTVRIIVHEDSPLDLRNARRDSLWLGEILRYAGHSRVLHCGPDRPDRTVYELRPPHGPGDHRQWAESNAARLRSFGINAAAAPEWKG